jgi:hypothetical protein
MIEAMDLVDEQNVARLQTGENGGEIAWAFYHRAGRDLDACSHLIGDDIGQRCLAQTRETVEQDVIQGFSPLSGRLDEDLQTLLDLILTDVLL